MIYLLIVISHLNSPTIISYDIIFHSNIFTYQLIYNVTVIKLKGVWTFLYML